MIYFLIPVFNEANNLELLHANLTEAVKGQDCFYVFSDDGSTDNSVKLLQQLFNTTNSIILGDGMNYGPGYAFNIGFEWVLSNSKNENDIIITLEADNTSDLGILPQMIGNINLGFDLALASIYVQGGGFEKTTFLRKVLSSGANLLLRFVFDIRVQTLSSFYRIYSISILRKIKDKYKTLIDENGFLCMIEILFKAIHCNGRIIEIPMILISSKRVGKSKMKLMKTTISYLRFLVRFKF